MYGYGVDTVTMKILIAGMGSIGRRHLRNFQALNAGDFVLLRTRRSTLPDDELEGLHTEHDLKQALQKHSPNIVVISNPTSLHLDIAIPAAEAGCNLLLEKPISHNMERVSILSKIVKQNDLRVLVGFQFRFHPGLQYIKQLLENNAIGPVTYVHVHWGEHLPAWHPWEDYRKGYAARSDLGGGVLLTLCHPFDYLRWIIGEVDAVSAMMSQEGGLDIEVEDSANVILRFADGVLGSVHLDYIQRPPTHTLEINGQNGRILWDNEDGAVHWHQADKEAWQTKEMSSDFERNTLFINEANHLLNCIKDRAEPCVNLDDGIATQKIVLAAKQSNQEGKEIVIK